MKLNRRRTHTESDTDSKNSMAQVVETGTAEAVAVEQAAVAEEEQQTPIVDTAQVDAELKQESVLIEKARTDPDAFAKLYENYVDRIYAYIYHRVGNVHDAEDLTARTFYRALERLDQYEDRGLPFSAWLFRIAHNLVANWHRDRSRRRFLSFDRLWGHSHDDETPERQVEREQSHNALWEAIERLPEDRRNLLLFKFGSQLSNVEIGEMLNKSESAIKSLYFRTLGSLREDLESRGWGPELEADEDEPSDVQADTDSSDLRSGEELQ